MDTAEKTHENRIRRIAERRGLRLEKSRRRDPRATDYGTYRLVDAETNAIEAYGDSSLYGLTLDEIEAQLIGAPRFHRAGLGEHVDAERGSVITVKPGAVLDMAADHGRRFVAEEDGSLQEIEPGD